MIANSIVVLAVFSLSGELLWDVRYGDYSSAEFRTALDSFHTTMLKKKKKDERVLVVNPSKHRKVENITDHFSRLGWQILKFPVSAQQLNPLHFYFSDMR